MNEAGTDGSYLCRQPILNRDQDLVGYELAMQTSGEVKSPGSMLVCAAYAELGIRSALGRHAAFLRVDEDFLHDDAIEALPPDGVVLQISLDRIPDERTIERCRALRDRHYALALSDYQGLDERSKPLLTMLDYIKIDIRGKDEKTLRALAGSLSRLPLRLLAEGVDNRDEMQLCLDAGFQFFQGYYFARPEIVSGRRLTASQARLVQLINLAAQDAETLVIEEGIKHEPALAINLLSLVNSAAFALPRRISSLQQAITVLGRRHLQRWLQLLLLTPPGKTPDPGRVPLLQVAALRGRMMEMLAGRLRGSDAKLTGQSFVAGVMSMMPAALGMPMAEIVEQIALEQEVMTAVTAHGGELGRLLTLIELFDAEDVAGCDRLLEGFAARGLERGTLNTCLTESLRWVNSA